jgi:hypothetical protein
MHVLPRLRRNKAEFSLPELRRQFCASPRQTGEFARKISGFDRALLQAAGVLGECANCLNKKAEY